MQVFFFLIFKKLVLHWKESNKQLFETWRNPILWICMNAGLKLNRNFALQYVGSIKKLKILAILEDVVLLLPFVLTLVICDK